MTIDHVLAALQDMRFASAIREGTSLFPWIESLHVLAIVTVVGTISIVDLRLLGAGAHVKSHHRLMAQLLPITWTTFAVAATSGFLLFSSNAVKYAANGPFRVKMVLLLGAGANMLVFHLLTHRHMAQWDEGKAPPMTKFAGAASLTVWVAVIAAARWIGFTLI